MKNKKSKTILWFLITLVILVTGIFLVIKPKPEIFFNSSNAMRYVQIQMDYGPRVPGSQAHKLTGDWIAKELSKSGWGVEDQEIEYNQAHIRNLIGKKGKDGPWIILGAHYDTRAKADRDPSLENQETPVPGANDGASGVAVLLELAKSLPDDLNKKIWLVFFDAEDGGNSLGEGWSLGSTAFVQNLSGKPDSVIIVDMVGDADLTLYYEGFSDIELESQIWAAGQELGHKVFIPTPKHQIIDDHLPFLEAGIPAIDIIDIDYPYWHTTQDTYDKISEQSLNAVGDTLLHWLIEGSQIK